MLELSSRSTLKEVSDLRGKERRPLEKSLASDESRRLGMERLLEAHRRGKAERKMPPAERRRAEREAARNRVGCWFPPHLLERLRERAERVSCSFSNLCEFGLRAGLALMEGEDSLCDLLVPISHPRWARKFPGSEKRFVAIDLPRELESRVAVKSEEWGCSKSSAASLLLHIFMEEELFLKGCLSRNRHPKWQHKLEWPEGGLEFLRKPPLEI